VFSRTPDGLLEVFVYFVRCAGSAIVSSVKVGIVPAEQISRSMISPPTSLVPTSGISDTTLTGVGLTVKV